MNKIIHIRKNKNSIFYLLFSKFSFLVLFSIFYFLFSVYAVKAESSNIPEQLFDINLAINDEAINSIDELRSSAVFVSFGKAPTPVDITFTILDSVGNQVYKERDSIVVETEYVLTREFKGLSLKPGKYELVLETVYNVSVRDEFKKNFEIVKGGINIASWLSQFWVFMMALIVIATVIVYQNLNPANEQTEKSASDAIRTIEDSRVVNNIMIANRYIVSITAFLFIYLTWVLNMIRFNPLIALFLVVPMVVATNSIWLWYCRKTRGEKFYFLPQILADTGLILAVVYYTGGLYSDFLFLPIIVLSLAALVSFRLSFVVFALSASFYFYLFFWQMWGLSFEEIFRSLGGLAGMKLIRILIFVFVGILMSFVISYFIKEIKRRNKEIEEVKKENYSKVVRGLCDPLIAIRWILEELDKKELISRNPELERNINVLRLFEKETSEVVKKSLMALDNDFLPQKS